MSFHLWLTAIENSKIKFNLIQERWSNKKPEHLQQQCVVMEAQIAAFRAVFQKAGLEIEK